MKEGIRGIIKGCVFFLFLVYGCKILSNVFMEKATIENSNWPNTTTFANFYNEDKDSIDILFLGSSVVVNAISPEVIMEEYGIQSYNLASSKQSFLTSYYWLKEALKYQSPKIVVIDSFLLVGIEPSVFNSEEGMMHTAFDPMRVGRAKMEAIADICKLDATEKPVYWIMPCARFHDRWKFLEEFEKILMQRAFSVETINKYVLFFELFIKRYNIYLASMLVMALSMIFLKDTVLSIALFLICMAEDYYLLVLNRMYFRSEYGLYLVLLLLPIAIVLVRGEDAFKFHIKIERRGLRPLLMIVFICSILVLDKDAIREDYDQFRSKREYSNVSVVNEYIENHPGVYLGSTLSLAYEDMNSYSWSYVMENNSKTNLMYTGGWMNYSPYDIHVREIYGVRNPFNAIADGKDILLIEANPEYISIYEQFLYEHYNVKMAAMPIASIDGRFTVYGFVSIE